jgi:hypothetical protein
MLAYFLLPTPPPKLSIDFFPPRPIFTFFLALFMIAPTYRTSILSFGSFYVFFAILHKRLLIDFSYSVWISLFATITALCFICYLFYHIAKVYEQLPRLLRKYPQIYLHSVIWLILISGFFLLGPNLIPHSGPTIFLWLLLTVLPYITWRLGYLLMSGKRTSAKKSRFQDHLFYLGPLYGGALPLPIGKGYDYLLSNASKSDVSQAKSQLAGIRLLILAKVWWLTQILLLAVIYGEFQSWIPNIFHSFHLDLPKISVIMGSPALSGFSRLDGWFSVLIALVNETLGLSIFGHGLVGALRLFGFYAFRNTYKPLLSQTILEFWNRYYYYFKELLVEFFFYPTYLAYFKDHPRLRLFAATMAAAFLGNVYYHVFRVKYLVTLTSMDIQGAFSYVAPRAFYSFLLALGIYVSFLRQKKKQGQIFETGRWWARLYTLRRISLVILFIAIIRIWVEGDAQLNFIQRTNFFLWLIGFK